MKLRLSPKQATHLYELLDIVIEESLERDGVLSHDAPLLGTAHRTRRQIFNLLNPGSRLPAWTPAECKRQSY